MYEHKFEPTDGILMAKSVIGNISASEEKLEEGQQIAMQLADAFGKGEDLAVRVGYDDADRLSEAKSRLDALTKFKVRLEESCDEVRQGLDSDLGDLRKLVLGAPDAATSAIGDKRADIGAVVLRLLPLVVTDLPAALEKFPDLRDALSPDIVEVRQTQISSGQVGDEQLEDLRKQVERLERQCGEETKKADSAAKGREKAESRLRATSAELAKLKATITGVRGELEEATAAAEGKESSLEELRGRAGELEQKLEHEAERAARYRHELSTCEGKLEIASTNAQNHSESASHFRKLYQSEREKRAQATKSATLRRLEKDLEAERALNAASDENHARKMELLEASHKAAADRMQGQVEELRSQALRAGLAISSRDTRLGQVRSDRDRLATRLKKYKTSLADKVERMAQARSDAKEVFAEWRRRVGKKDEELAQKDGELEQKDQELAERAEWAGRAQSTMARLRRERDELRANSKAAQDSSVTLENAQREIAVLTEENDRLREHCREANRKQSLASRQLRLKADQLKKGASALSRESASAKKLEAELCEREQQLESAALEIDVLKDDVQGLQGTIAAKEGMIDEKSRLIGEQDRMLSDEAARASRDRESSLARVRQLEQQVEAKEARLEARQRELTSARLTLDQLPELRQAVEERQDKIDSLQEELTGLRLHGSHRAEEMTENHRQISKFLANMAGFQSDGLMFSGLVDAIIEKDNRFCAAAAPAMWTILRPWDGSPAGAAGALPPAPRSASLQIGAVLLLGEASSGNLNSERSRAVLDDLTASIRSENTSWVPMAVMTELARKVVMAIREAGNVRMEFSLAFWQLMDLVDHRTGRVAAPDSPWLTHKGSLSAELSRHPCSLVFELLRDSLPLANHELCRLFGDSLGLCSSQNWESAVMFDTESRTLRFVNKALISLPDICTLKIGPEPGHGAVELQLQPSDNIWLMENL